jgi:hypothetical protein
LQKIGWDLIPEEARETIIKELNNGLYLAKWVWITPWNIDIDNWLFWEINIWLDKKWSGNEWEKTFARLMNKIVTWNIDWNYGDKKVFINLDNIGQDVSTDSNFWNIWWYNSNIMRQKLIENWMAGLNFSLENVRNNLKKEEKIK